MMPTAALSGFTRQLENFQNHQVINKAVMDVVGVDIPMIGLAKNNTERKERAFRQFLVLMFAFIVAPLHARFVARQVSGKLFTHLKPLLQRHHLHPEILLKASMKELQQGLPETRQTLKKLLPEPVYAAIAPHIDNSFRQTLIRGKSLFLSLDMAVEGALFASIGWIKNAFTKLFWRC